MGDFYESFDGDAKVLSDVLGIALTSRPMGREEGRLPLAGVPHHQLERHVERLVSAGHRVAIAEQVSPPGRGLMERRVVRVVSPGTVDTGAAVEGVAHNWLVAAAPAPAARATIGERAPWGIARCDVTTDELEIELLPAGELAGGWSAVAPRRTAALRRAGGKWRHARGRCPASRLRAHPAAAPRLRPPPRCRASRRALRGRGPRRLRVEGMEASVGAVGAPLAYLEEGWPQAPRHSPTSPGGTRRRPRLPRPADPQTRRPADPSQPRPLRGRTTARRLAGGDPRPHAHRDGRAAPARAPRPTAPERRGGRGASRRGGSLRQHDARPLRCAGGAQGIPDLERLLGRVRSGSAGARHLLQLAQGLARLPALRTQAAEAGDPPRTIAAALAGCEEIAEAITSAIAEDAPADPGDQPTIQAGVDAEVDRLRTLATDARSALAALEQAERERSGISSLRVGYHRVLGYYLEVPRSQAERVPDDFERRQALSGSQRFRTPALASLESEILSARERLLAAERAALARTVAQVAESGERIARASEAVARLDVASTLAEAGTARAADVHGVANARTCHQIRFATSSLSHERDEYESRLSGFDQLVSVARMHSAILESLIHADDETVSVLNAIDPHANLATSPSAGL